MGEGSKLTKILQTSYLEAPIRQMINVRRSARGGRACCPVVLESIPRGGKLRPTHQVKNNNRPHFSHTHTWVKWNRKFRVAPYTRVMEVFRKANNIRARRVATAHETRRQIGESLLPTAPPTTRHHCVTSPVRWPRPHYR